MMKQYVKALRETVALSLCRHSESGGWVMEDNKIPYVLHCG